MASRKAEFGPAYIAEIMVELSSTRSIDELFEENQAFSKRTGVMSKGFIHRIQLLEEFHTRVSGVISDAQGKVRRENTPLADEAIAEFVQIMGLRPAIKRNRTDHEAMELLNVFFIHLIQNGQQEPLAMWFNSRTEGTDNEPAKIPRDARVAALRHVQREFGIQDHGTARKRLNRALTRIEKIFGSRLWYSALKIPGGDE